MAASCRDPDLENYMIKSFDELDDTADEAGPPKNGRQKLDLWLNHLWVQVAVVIIVIVDTVIVISLLIIDLIVKNSDTSSTTTTQVPSVTQVSHTARQSSLPSNETPTSGPGPITEAGQHTKEATEVLHAINLLILLVFLLEIILRLAARGLNIIEDRWQFFDGLVVLTTSVLYIALTAASPRSHTVRFSLGLLIVLRLWRIGRIYYAITQPIKRKAERIINAHRKSVRQLEEKIQSSFTTVEQQQKEIESLREQIKVLQGGSHVLNLSTVDSAGTSTNSPVEGYTRPTTATVLELVSEDLAHQNNQTPNGSVQNGTPTSSCSHTTTETVDTAGVTFGERSRSRSVPDLVEHTENVQVVIRDDKKLLPGSENGHKIKRSSKSPYAFNRSHSVPDLVEHIENIQVVIKDDKKLNSDKKSKSQDDEGHLNKAFETDAATTEEMMEIRRISQIPFEDIDTYTTRDGIPMTDL